MNFEGKPDDLIVSELNLLYQTVNRIDNGTVELKNLLEDHIYQIAIEQINDIPQTDQNLKVYIQTIADLYQRYLLLVEKAFHNDQSFLHVLDRVSHPRCFRHCSHRFN